MSLRWQDRALANRPRNSLVFVRRTVPHVEVTVHVWRIFDGHQQLAEADVFGRIFRERQFKKARFALGEPALVVVLSRVPPYFEINLKYIVSARHGSICDGLIIYTEQVIYFEIQIYKILKQTPSE